MKLEEPIQLCDQTEARWNDPNLPRIGSEPKFQLVVPGCKEGRRCRVMPGLMGDVLSPGDENTLVVVKVKDVRKVIARIVSSMAQNQP